MADWDEDEFEPEAPGIAKEQLKGLWDDEDVEDEDVKESWEDEDDNAKKVSMKESAPDKNSESKPKKTGVVKKEKVPEAKISEAADDILAEKLRQQRLVEEADYKATTELFAKKGGEQSLDNFIPKSEHDFMEYAELLSHKIRSYEKSYHYIGLLKAVMRISMSSLKAADAKEISSSVAAIANEKLKAEKEANAGKKKQGAKKKQLHMDKPDDDLAASSFDDAADEFDFM